MFFFTESARAQSAPEIEATVDAGFEGCLVEDAWMPVRVTLTASAGSPPISGRIVSPPLVSERVSASEAPFVLAPLSDAPARVTVLLALPPRTELGFELRIEDDRGREIAPRKAPKPTPTRLTAGERLVLAAPASMNLASLAAAGARATPGGPQTSPGLRIAKVAASDLPSRAWLLQGASAIFLSHDETASLRDLASSREHVLALEAFVRSGRTLVVSGGSGKVPFWKDTPLDALLPVTASGERFQVAARDLEPLGPPPPERPAGEPPPLVTLERRAGAFGDVSAMRATLRPGARVDLGTEGSPLAVTRPLGRGQVVFLAFDPDDRAIRAGTKLGAFLLDRLRIADDAAARIVPHSDRLAATSEKAFFARSPIGTKGLFGLSLAVLAAAAILGPVAARRRLSPVRTFVAPLLSAVLAGIVVLFAWATRPSSEALVLTYAFADSSSKESSREAVAVSDVGLFAGDETAIDVELDGTVSLQPVDRGLPKLECLHFRSRGAALRLAHGAAPRVTPLEMPALGFAWLRVGGTVALKEGAWIDASASDGKLVVSTPSGETPEGGLALRAPDGAGDSLVVPLGALERGKPREVSFDEASGARPLKALIEEDEALGPLRGREAASAARSHLLAALLLIHGECVSPRPHGEPPLPRTWVALPGPALGLARPFERGRPLGGRSLDAILIAARDK